jgi:hypothetical protein
MTLIVNLDGTVTGFPIGVKKQYFNLIEQENEVRDLLDEWPDEVETLKLVRWLTSESTLHLGRVNN